MDINGNLWNFDDLLRFLLISMVSQCYPWVWCLVPGHSPTDYPLVSVDVPGYPWILNLWCVLKTWTICCCTLWNRRSWSQLVGASFCRPRDGWCEGCFSRMFKYAGDSPFWLELEFGGHRKHWFCLGFPLVFDVSASHVVSAGAEMGCLLIVAPRIWLLRGFFTAHIRPCWSFTILT